MAHTHTTACEDRDGGYSNCTGEDNTPSGGGSGGNNGSSANKPKGPNPPWERRR